MANLKTRLYTLGLILISAVLTYILSLLLSNSLYTIFIPGILFGLALMLPNVNYSRLSKDWVWLIPLVFGFFGAFMSAIGLMLGLINNSETDQAGLIILGLISGLLFSALLNLFYRFEKKLIIYMLFIVFGVATALLCDYIYFSPQDKKNNFGKIMAIWQSLFGILLVLFVDFKGKPVEVQA